MICTATIMYTKRYYSVRHLADPHPPPGVEPLRQPFNLRVIARVAASMYSTLVRACAHPVFSRAYCCPPGVQFLLARRGHRAKTVERVSQQPREHRRQKKRASCYADSAPPYTSPGYRQMWLQLTPTWSALGAGQRPRQLPRSLLCPIGALAREAPGKLTHRAQLTT